MDTSTRAGGVRAAGGSHATGPAWGKLTALALAVIGVAAVWRYTALSDFLTPGRVLDWAEAFRHSWWAPLAVIAAYTPACLTLFPRPLITLFAVVAFGPVQSFAYTMSGILLASLTTYYIGRLLPENSLRDLVGPKMDEVSGVLRKRGLLAVFAVRILPLAPFAIEGMVAGRLSIKLWHFMLGTFLGMLPGTLTTMVFGDQIRTALEDPSRINWTLVGGAIVVFVALALIARRWFAGQRDEQRLVANDRP
jgi:uncharacterized membrane protein YdjX (TVP38/TMEM64 family)